MTVLYRATARRQSAYIRTPPPWAQLSRAAGAKECDAVITAAPVRSTSAKSALSFALASMVVTVFTYRD
jgi:hypothetical protein